MPNPRLPNELKKAKGTLNVTRDKDFLNITLENRIVKIPEPPKYFNKWALLEWDIVWQFLTEYKLAAIVDVSLICAYCQQMGKYHYCEEECVKHGYISVTPGGREVAHPLNDIGNQALKNAKSIAAEFGFTPAARSRISMPKKESAPDANDITSLIDG